MTTRPSHSRAKLRPPIRPAPRPTSLHSDALRSFAKKLRKEFEIIMSDAHSPDRFQWDWWHLPGRYTHLRTPAARFFSESAMATLTARLQAYGREHLGCQELSPIWLSLYVEGCEQRLHADRPHGPWAFVLSLTPETRVFQGGETMLIRPEVLSLWDQGVPRGQAFEETEIVDRIASQAGQLLVFDPRIPHGVSRVSGTVNPLEGRLVIHGWFAQPNPFIDGSLSPQAAEQALAAFDDVLAKSFTDGFESTGTTAFRIHIAPTGRVQKVIRLASSLISARPETEYVENRKLATVVRDHFLNWKFPKSRGASTLTLPLSFER